MEQASRNVSAMRLVFPDGSLAHSAGLHAESMRTTPYLRMPSSRSCFAMAQAFRTCSVNFRLSSWDPMAEPPPVVGQTGATSDPTTNPLLPMFSASSFKSSAEASISVCGLERNRSTPSNLIPSTPAAWVRSSIVYRPIGGSESGPLPTRPGHIALCNLGNSFMSPLPWLAQRLGVRVSRPEMFQDNQWIRGASIPDRNSLSGSPGRDEQL